jgi:hypothetical protein
MNLPDLQPGRTYTRAEVRPYITTLKPGDPDDWDLAQLRWVPKDPGRRRRLLDRTQLMCVEYALMPICELELFIQERHTWFSTLADEEARVQKILRDLEAGEIAYPVFVPGDDRKKIREGQHRGVAFWLHGAKLIPVFLIR